MKLIHKDVFREIKKSAGRFISLVLIITLGVGIYSGIRSCDPDMRLTADTFYDQCDLYDLRVISTLGLSDLDVAALERVKGIESATGTYSYDALCQAGSKQIAMHIMACTEGVNGVLLKEGKMPENDGECIVDVDCMKSQGFSLGDKIVFSSGTEEDISTALNRTEFTIVGTFSSPMKISLSYGTTDIGNGELAGNVMVDESVFCLGYYTEIDVVVKDCKDLICYSDEYEQLVDDVEDRIEGISDARRQARLDELRSYAEDQASQAKKQVDEGREQLDAGKQLYEENLAKLEESKNQLAAGIRDLENGKLEIAAYKKQLTAAEKEIAAYEKQLAEGKVLLEAGKKELADGKAELKKSEPTLAAAKKEIEAGEKELAAGKAQLEEGKSQLSSLEMIYTLMGSIYESVDPVLDQMEMEPETSYFLMRAMCFTVLPTFNTALRSMAAQAGSQFPSIVTLYNTVNRVYRSLLAHWTIYDGFQSDMDSLMSAMDAAYTDMGKEMTAAKAEIAEAEKQIAAAEKELAEGKAKYEEGKKLYDEAAKKVADGEKELAAKQKEYDAGVKEIAKNKQLVSDGWKEIAKQEKKIVSGQAEIESAQQQIAEGEQQLADGQAEIESGERELSEAEQEIAEALAEIDNLELPDWYVLDRSFLGDYSSYGADAERLGAVGMVFPVIFFLVAALVCLTNMTRMVDEERTQIGTLKALGYSRRTIMSKYVTYALLAIAAGSLIGVFVGGKALPVLITNVYKTMYPCLGNFMCPYNLEHSLVAVGAALVAIIAATLFACVRSLREAPANLMRPVTPKRGRKLLLERMPGVWKVIPFTWKNALRNFVRYKKRLFMTLFGIIGSTALLLVGFGLNDAVNTVLYSQFDNITKYDESITLDAKSSEEETSALREHLSADARFAGFKFAYLHPMSAVSASESEPMTVYLTVPGDLTDLDKYIDLHQRKTGEHVSLTDDGVVISEKLSKELGIGVGDTITVSENKLNERALTVVGIVENYVYHYVYMTPALYQKTYGDLPEYNQVLVINKEGVEVDADAFGTEYVNLDGVAGVSCTRSLIDDFDRMLQSMDAITLILIICAGALTFVVLYNLNNINISERRRELATLKVLGFYDRELSQYIYRENVLITIIGVALGVVGGIFLNRYVVNTVEVDVVMFGREIFLASFAASILLAVGFAAIVNFLMHFKLKKIDMATSLKSVE